MICLSQFLICLLIFWVFCIYLEIYENQQSFSMDLFAFSLAPIENEWCQLCWYEIQVRKYIKWQTMIFVAQKNIEIWIEQRRMFMIYEKLLINHIVKKYEFWSETFHWLSKTVWCAKTDSSFDGENAHRGEDSSYSLTKLHLKKKTFFCRWTSILILLATMRSHSNICEH